MPQAPEKLPRGAGPGTDDSLQKYSKMIRDAGTSLTRLRNPKYGFDIQLAPPSRVASKSVARKVSKR